MTIFLPADMDLESTPGPFTQDVHAQLVAQGGFPHTYLWDLKVFPLQSLPKLQFFVTLKIDLRCSGGGSNGDEEGYEKRQFHTWLHIPCPAVAVGLLLLRFLKCCNPRHPHNVSIKILTTTSVIFSMDSTHKFIISLLTWFSTSRAFSAKATA